MSDDPIYENLPRPRRPPRVPDCPLPSFGTPPSSGPPSPGTPSTPPPRLPSRRDRPQTPLPPVAPDQSPPSEGCPSPPHAGRNSPSAVQGGRPTTSTTTTTTGPFAPDLPPRRVSDNTPPTLPSRAIGTTSSTTSTGGGGGSSTSSSSFEPPPVPGGRAGLPPPLPASRPPCQGGSATKPSVPDVFTFPTPVAGPTTLSSVDKLEKGVVVVVFSLKKRPEPLNMLSLQDLYILQCLRSKDTPEITVDLAHVQEIRCGRRSIDFERWPDEANRVKKELCLTVFYGVEAMPNSLAIAAKSQDDFNIVYAALTQLRDRVRKQTYQEKRQLWFKRQFHSIVGYTMGRKTEDMMYKVTVKQLRTWMMKNCKKASKKDVVPVIQTLALSDNLKFGGFVYVVTEIMKSDIVKGHLKDYTLVIDGVRSVTPNTFAKFLREKQNETTTTEADAKALIRLYLEGKDAQLLSKSSVDLTEFEDFLFSPMNSLWSPENTTIHQDMTRPLTDYWVASSHNTYLTKHQLHGLSSDVMYARCLRMGCRCLELDCWDGNEDGPIITHGRTRTTKIKVVDVLKVIKENAWQASEYPIILSIENHLSLPQQRHMAQLLRDIFNEDLLTEPIDPRETKMPSPEQLKRKIIIKDRKLGDRRNMGDSEDSSVGSSLSLRQSFRGQKSSTKMGTLNMKNPDDKKWYPFTVGLTESTIFYTNERKDDDDEDAEEDIDYDEYFADYDSDDDEDDLSCQPWYYDVAKKDVKTLLKAEKKKPPGRRGTGEAHKDGTFLIRRSERGAGATDTGDSYSLSFIWEGDLRHVRVKTKESPEGRVLYSIGNEVWRDSIVQLVRYFRNHRLVISNENTALYLDKPLCKPHEHIPEPWYRPEMNRVMSEKLLLRVSQEGAFVVRASSEPGCFCISFRRKQKINHFRVQKRGKAYLCGSYRFRSLTKMVEYFHRRPLWRKTKLTVPATEKMAGCHEDNDCDIYEDTVYSNPSEIEDCKTVSVRALYDFMGRAEENELSFPRGAIITNVKEEDKAWWKGDFLGNRQKTFPASYVQVMKDNEEKKSQSLRAKEDTLELRECTVDNGPYVEHSPVTQYCFHIQHERYTAPLQFGCESLLQLEEWVTAIRGQQQRLEEWNREAIKEEKEKKRAREYSDLIVYCQAISYNAAEMGRYYNVSSLTEDKVNTSDDAILEASRRQFLRVYPKATRFNSSNYDPVLKWASGAQMVALNYQTPDLGMQLNQARFLSNGRCGYVLKPEFLRESKCSLSDVMTNNVPQEPKILSVTVLAGRHLSCEGRMLGVRPFVGVEVIGLPMDNSKQRTPPVDEDNALNPVWCDEAKKFEVSCPDLAFLHFEVATDDDNKAPIAQATFPVNGLRQGYRSVPLKNVFSEDLHMSSLLVHIDIKTPKDKEEEYLFHLYEGCRRYRADLMSRADSGPKADHTHAELLKTERKIMEYLQNSRQKGGNGSGKK